MTQGVRDLENTFARAWVLLSRNWTIVVPGLVLGVVGVGPSSCDPGDRRRRTAIGGVRHAPTLLARREQDVDASPRFVVVDPRCR